MEVMPCAAVNFCKMPSNTPGPYFYTIDVSQVRWIPPRSISGKRVCEGQCVVQQQVAGANGTRASPSIKVPWEDPKTTLNFILLIVNIWEYITTSMVHNDCGKGCTVRTARGCKAPLRRVVIRREKERQRQTGKPFVRITLEL